MTHREAFTSAVARLKAAAVPTESPDLDARVLLAHAAGLSSAALLARWPDPLPEAAAAAFGALVDRRAVGEPVAWITGVQEFYGLEFEVGPGLLVPRADTETLVEAAREVWPRGPGVRAADVCTGTGCVAVALAHAAPDPAEVWAGDVEPRAVETAGRNAAKLLARPRSVRVVTSDLLDNLPGPWHLIVSNPPYLTPAETHDRVGAGGWKEPALALDGGGDDGLELIRRLVAQAAERLLPGGWLLIEAGGPQSPTVAELLVRRGFDGIRIWKDLAGIDRVSGGRKR